MTAGRRALVLVLVLAGVLSGPASAFGKTPQPAPWDPTRGLLISGATVVTMDAAHDVIQHGSVLVRDGLIVAVWGGPKPPAGVSVGDATVVEAGPQELLFPGLIDIHDHPSFDAQPTWLPPSSHALPSVGKSGTDPYDNRYEWGATGSPTTPPEQLRLIVNPSEVLTDSLGLDLGREVNRYAQTAALLGGETMLEEGDGDVIRSVEHTGFPGPSRIAPSRVPSIATLSQSDLTSLLAAMQGGDVDAWILHLAEGVRDGDRRPGDPFSSRAEFTTLKADGLLTDETVIVHGTALERSDFAEMRAAPSPRTNGTGDDLGAKLVWSPLSNLLLYGRTTNVYDALAEGVLISLGTDWSPSGSRTLLDELDVADVALRDERILGGSRDEVPTLALAGKNGVARQEAAMALDRALADMVTRNPALALRMYDRVGSIEAGKVADFVLVHRPARPRPHGTEPSVYRDLIDATAGDVELVLLGGEPRAGDVDVMSALKPGDEETVACACGFAKAVDVTSMVDLPTSAETLAQTESVLQAGLTALGGDHPPDGGGPGPLTNTYSYLQHRVAGGLYAGLPPSVFTFLLGSIVGTLSDGSVNLEAMALDPLFEQDDQLLAALLHGDVDQSTGLLAVASPPYRLYPANLNFAGPGGNPLASLP
jgi:cytosine/adenosine deaminase-related metal-dependent hydrolase